MAKKTKKDLELEERIFDFLKHLQNELQTISEDLGEIIQNVKESNKNFPSEDLSIVMNAKSIYDPFLGKALEKLINGHN